MASSALAESTPTSQLLAEKLFQEARAALEAGRIDEACPKLADSHRLDPAGGTVLLHARCLEQQGRLATAWAEYHEALAFARRDGRDDRAARAKERIAVLEPRLPRLEVALPAARPPGLEMILDGTPVPPSAWSSAVPVDPGRHRLEARAPSCESSSIDLLAREGLHLRARVPELACTEPKENRGEPLLRDAGTILLAVGGGALVAGAIAGVAALRWDARADRACPGAACADAGAVATSEQAGRAALIANVALAAGVAFVAGGTVLVLTAAEPSRGHSRAPERASVALVGEF